MNVRLAVPFSNASSNARGALGSVMRTIEALDELAAKDPALAERTNILAKQLLAVGDVVRDVERGIADMFAESRAD
jgi:hypothetical protein